MPVPLFETQKKSVVGDYSLGFRELEPETFLVEKRTNHSKGQAGGVDLFSSGPSEGDLRSGGALLLITGDVEFFSTGVFEGDFGIEGSLLCMIDGVEFVSEEISELNVHFYLQI